MTGETLGVCSDKRKPFYEHQSAAISINQHQSATISISQHQLSNPIRVDVHKYIDFSARHAPLPNVLSTLERMRNNKMNATLWEAEVTKTDNFQIIAKRGEGHSNSKNYITQFSVQKGWGVKGCLAFFWKCVRF